MAKKLKRVYLHIRPSNYARTVIDGVEISIPRDFEIDRMTKGGPATTGKGGEVVMAVDVRLDPAVFATLGFHAVLDVGEDDVTPIPIVAEVSVGRPEVTSEADAT